MNLAEVFGQVRMIFFYPRRVRTKTFKQIFSNRVVSILNSLPKDLRQEQKFIFYTST